MVCQRLDWDCSAYPVSRLYQYFDPHHQNHADSGEFRDTNVPLTPVVRMLDCPAGVPSTYGLCGVTDGVIKLGGDEWYPWYIVLRLACPWN